MDTTISGGAATGAQLARIEEAARQLARDRIEIRIPGEQGALESVTFDAESVAGVIAVHLATHFRGRPQPVRQRTGLAPHKLHKVLAYIEEHLAEPIGVRELAAVVFMSPFHFARLFKQATGTPPHAYMTFLRMERAKKLLASSDLALVEIAASVGYQTQSHFTGVFHKHVGVAPRAYRLNALAERDGH